MEHHFSFWSEKIIRGSRYKSSIYINDPLTEFNKKKTSISQKRWFENIDVFSLSMHENQLIKVKSSRPTFRLRVKCTVYEYCTRFRIFNNYFNGMVFLLTNV